MLQSIPKLAYDYDIKIKLKFCLDYFWIHYEYFGILRVVLDILRVHLGMFGVFWDILANIVFESSLV